MASYLKRRFGHWSPRYIKDRMALFLTEKRHPHAPWLTRDAVKILSSLARPEDSAIEFGSGRSTLWFAKRIAHLVSFEHDPDWFRKVKGMLEESAARNVEQHLKEGKAYVSDIAGYRDEGFDFALVDGVYRDECALAVLPKIKRGGFLIIDNCNWFLPSASVSPDSRRTDFAKGGWEELYADRMKGWRQILTSNGVTDTAFFFKP
jgi:predicted O-methyltransferase YrrM